MLKHPSIIHACAAVAAVIILLITVCAPLQRSLGMTGLALTEVIVLAAAAAGAFAVSRVTGEPLSSFFPLKIVSARQLFGSLIVYFGGYFVMYAAAAVIQYVFPGAAQEAAELIQFTTSVPLWLGVVITAVMPAVCEESLHRGLVLRCLRGSADVLLSEDHTAARSAFVAVAGGFLFGLFHLDPYRFLTTAILGGAFSYVCYKSGSMLPGIMLHFINNMTSVGAMYSQPAAEEMTPEAEEALNLLLERTEALMSSPRAVAGTALIMLGWGILFLRLGQRLMTPRRVRVLASPFSGMYGETGSLGDQAFPPAGSSAGPQPAERQPEPRSAPQWLKSLAIILTVIALLTIGTNLVASSLGDMNGLLTQGSVL